MDRMRGRVASCGRRRARTQASAARAVTPGDLFAALRDHGEGPSPRWSPLNGALSAPCAHAGGMITATQTTASWVADLREAPLHWATATAAPCTSLFKPVRVGEPADLGPAPTDRFDGTTTWWRHELLHRAVLADHAALTARFSAARERVERAWLADPPTTDEAFSAAGDLEAAWLADVHSAALPDRRPRWLRGRWSRWDEAAALPAADLPVAGRPARELT